MIRLLRLFRRDPFALKALSTLNVVGDLESQGCRVLAAAVLPSPAVRVDRPPQGLATWGHRCAVPGTIAYTLEHVATINGVRVTWQAVPGATDRLRRIRP